MVAIIFVITTMVSAMINTIATTPPMIAPVLSEVLLDSSITTLLDTDGKLIMQRILSQMHSRDVPSLLEAATVTSYLTPGCRLSIVMLLSVQETVITFS